MPDAAVDEYLGTPCAPVAPQDRRTDAVVDRRVDPNALDPQRRPHQQHAIDGVEERPYGLQRVVERDGKGGQDA